MTRMQWAIYYSQRPSPEACHLCWWYLLLAEAFGDT